MAIAKVRISDDGGPILGRVALLLPADPFAVIRIGDVELTIAGVGDMAAERCRMFAGEFERLRLDLLNADRKTYDAAALLAGAAELEQSRKAARDREADGPFASYLSDDVHAAFDVDTLGVTLTTVDDHQRIDLSAEVLDALGGFIRRAVYARQEARS